MPPALPSDSEHTSSGNNISALIKTTDGGYALAGRALNEKHLTEEKQPFLIIKTNSAGTVQWNKTYGESGLNLAYAMVQTGDNGYALTGTAFNDIILFKTDKMETNSGLKPSAIFKATIVPTRQLKPATAGSLLQVKLSQELHREGYYYIVKTTKTTEITSPSAASQTASSARGYRVCR